MRAAFVPHRRERKMCDDISREPPVSSKQVEKNQAASVSQPKCSSFYAKVTVLKRKTTSFAS